MSASPSAPSAGAVAKPQLIRRSAQSSDAVVRKAAVEALHDRGGLLARRLRQQQRELVAAEPEGGVRRAQAGAQRLGDLAQGLVAGRVAEGVVDELEVVDVADDERELVAVADGALDLGVELAHERAPVREARQRILVGQDAKLLELAGRHHRHRRLPGEERERLEPGARGQEQVLGLVGPDAPDDRAAGVAQRDVQAVAVPGPRAAAAAVDAELGVRLGAARDGLLVGQQVAAAELEGGVEQEQDLLGRHLPARLRAARPADRRARREQPARGVDELDDDLLEAERLADAAAHGLHDGFDGRLLGELRRDGEQLLERGAMAARLGGAVGLLEGEGGVTADGDEEVELHAGRAPAGDGLTERDDREDVAVRVAAGDEQLVTRTPAVVLVAQVRRRPDEARADGGVVPVDRALGDEVRPALVEALVEDEVDPGGRVGRAEQRLAHLVRAEDDGGLVVVKLRAVDVDDDAGEADRVREDARDRVEHRRDALVAADHARDVHQRLETADRVDVLYGHAPVIGTAGHGYSTLAGSTTPFRGRPIGR